MIVIICGKPRVGKTALNTYFAKRSLQSSGRIKLKKCIEEINVLNAGRRSNMLTLPDVPPIYTNYEAKYHVGYKKYIEPLWVSPFYLGLPNDNMPTQFILPYGELHITEGQRYWDSRESASLPDHVSRWFETHGHFNLDIYIDVQRAMLIDKNIRALSKKIIEVQKMVHVKDVYGRILRTVWYCREFSSSAEYETYVNGGYAPYRVTRYTNEGNIFECYNSRSCKQDFVPPETKDFTLLKQRSSGEIKELPEQLKKFYLTQMPKAFRAPKNKGASISNGQGTRQAT